MKVFFRVDASVQLGSGHLMRCVTLAHELKNYGVVTHFICGDQIGNLNDWLQSQGMTVTVICSTPVLNVISDAEQTIIALNKVEPDWLVVDHYGLDFEWEKILRPYVLRIMVIDDHTGRIHDCDALLDQNYAVDASQLYSGLVPESCQMLIGPSFALLRKEFIELRPMVGRRESIESILLFFTGGDDQGETLKAMRGVEIYGKIQRVDVVVGRSNPQNDTIKNYCEVMAWGYHCQVDYMGKLIAQADLVIGAGGASNWERCLLGVPSLVAILAENQAMIAQALDQAGAVVNLGWANTLTPDDYAEALSGLDTHRLSEMSFKALKLVDGVGATRVVDAMLLSSNRPVN